MCNISSSQELDINKQLFSVKARVEEWFAANKSKVNDTEDRKSTRSSHYSKTHRSQSSTSRYSRTSSLLSSKIKEQQRKAELLARSASLKQKQELKMKKIQLKQQEKELSLKQEYLYPMLSVKFSNRLNNVVIENRIR